MKTKTKLIHFLKAKDRLIYDVTGLHYIYKTDLDYIKSLLPIAIEAIWKEIGRHTFKKKDYSEGLTPYTCPWCISKEFKFFDTCEECPYAITHGKCYRSKVSQKHYASHYDRIQWIMKDNKVNQYELLSNKLFKEIYTNLEEL